MKCGFRKFGVMLFVSLNLSAFAQSTKPVTASAQDPAQILQFLSRTIEWHRQLAVEREVATEPSDLAFFQENRRIADQVAQLAFEYARAQAQLQARQPATQPAAQPATSSGQYQRLNQRAQQTEQQINDTQAELQTARAKLAGAVGAKKRLLDAQVAELDSEIGLLEARRDALQTMIEFVSSSNSGGKGAGLHAQIEELARSVPAYLSQPEGTVATQASSQLTSTNTPVAKTPEPAGIWGLSAALLHLIGKVHTLKAEIDTTAALNQTATDLRKPIIDNMRSLIRQGDQLFAAADTSGAAQLAQQKQQLDALTVQFKQTSSQMLPLSKISVLLDIYQRTLANWRDAVREQERDDLRQLLLRLGVLAILIATVFVVGEIWRRTTFRYIRDARRRYQFLLLRRVVMWVAVILIVVLAFASQLGSAVTFAGLITAGVAVALQNVIVSVVAYFFLIGKYGIRVGDRVQIAGVTGEVVDIGLVRIHVMEQGGPGDFQPTGRIVAFSNSIVFQPTAGVFKQIPGTNFIWHELKLTLAPESDYQQAKERITKAVDGALAEYRESIENQRLLMERNLSTISSTELRPKVRLHYTAAGIEASVRYPVDVEKAGEMDEHLLKEVSAALERDPKLKLTGAETPIVRASS